MSDVINPNRLVQAQQRIKALANSSGIGLEEIHSESDIKRKKMRSLNERIRNHNKSAMFGGGSINGSLVFTSLEKKETITDTSPVRNINLPAFLGDKSKL